jgi:hypothetical protein
VVVLQPRYLLYCRAAACLPNWPPATTACCCYRVVSREDAPLIRAKGLAVVDCSWNRLDDVPFGELQRVTSMLYMLHVTCYTHVTCGSLYMLSMPTMLRNGPALDAI